MTPEECKGIARRYFNEVLNSGNVAAIDEIATPEFALHIATIPSGIHGQDGFKGFVTTLRTAFPDLNFIMDDEVAETDKSAVRWNFSGTHRGVFLDIQATGKVITDQGIDIFHFEDGKIKEMWVNEDALGLLRQLGALPP